MTPLTTFPAQPPTAEVPEMREAGSSKTSWLGRPKAWELKQRPKPRVARRQCGWVRGLSLPILPPPSHHSMHCCFLPAQPTRAEALCFPEALEPRAWSFNRSSGSSVTWSLHSHLGLPSAPLPLPLLLPNPPSTQPQCPHLP